MKSKLFLLLGGAIVLAGCATSARRGEPFTAAPNVSDPKLALGQRVFFANCNACHPGGDAGYGPSLRNKQDADWFIRLQVRSGLGAMPPFEENHLTNDRLEAVVAYVQALHGSGG